MKSNDNKNNQRHFMADACVSLVYALFDLLRVLPDPDCRFLLELVNDKTTALINERKEQEHERRKPTH